MKKKSAFNDKLKIYLSQIHFKSQFVTRLTKHNTNWKVFCGIAFFKCASDEELTCRALGIEIITTRKKMILFIS